ncbi:Flagellar hook protein FlgE [compost metagenome]|jgi:flagellar basal body rod protein FlgG
MSNLHYALLSGFKAVNNWQQHLVRNAQGLLLPGYNRTQLHHGAGPGESLAQPQNGTASHGSKAGLYGGGDSLSLSRVSIGFEQGELRPSTSPTNLAIQGEGFFILAENLRPGARLFLTRAGDFHYDTQGRLVNQNGMFVVGGPRLTDPPTPIRNPGDGTVALPDVLLGNVPVKSQLAISGYGPTVYDLTDPAGALQVFNNGTPGKVGFVQSNTLEMVNREGQLASLQVENTNAQQTYKMFKDFLDNYNRAVDDAISTVK